jgi:hypothetical protein
LEYSNGDLIEVENRMVVNQTEEMGRCGEFCQWVKHYSLMAGVNSGVQSSFKRRKCF